MSMSDNVLLELLQKDDNVTIKPRARKDRFKQDCKVCGQPALSTLTLTPVSLQQ